MNAYYSYLYKGYTQGFGAKFTLSRSFSAYQSRLQVYPHPENIKDAFELVPPKIVSVGRSLACVNAAEPAPEMSKSDAAIADQATLLLPGLCSGSSPFSAEDYSFTARFIYKNVGHCSNCIMQWRGGLELPPHNTGLVIFKSKVQSFGFPSSLSSSVRSSSDFWSNRDFSSHGPAYHSSPYVPWFKHIGPPGDEMEEDSIYHERIILKLFPMNRGRFTFRTNQYKAAEGFYATMVCRILVKHVGRNLLYKGAQSVPYPSTKISYHQERRNWSGSWSSLYSKVNVYATSWADKGHVVNTEAVADDDTIEVVFFHKIKDGSSLDGNETRQVKSYYHREYYAFSKTPSHFYTVIEKATEDDTSAPQLSINPEVGKTIGTSSLTAMYAGVPKIYPLILNLPKELNKNVTVKFINTHFDSKIYVDWCSIHVTTVGNNWPCLDEEAPFALAPMAESARAASGQLFHRYISIELEPQGHHQYSSSTEDSQVQVEVTFRPTAYTPATITIRAEVLVKGQESPETVETTFHKTTLPTSEISPGKAKLQSWGSFGTFQAGTRHWLPLKLEIPSGLTVPLKLAFNAKETSQVAWFTFEGLR